MKSKKPYIITGVLFAYMCAMALIFHDTLTVEHKPWQYFGTIAAETIVLALLFIFLRKREKLKSEREKDLQ